MKLPDRLLQNFSALTIMQVIQYLAPMIVLPYLVRVIGPEKFGVISFAQVIAFYFTLLPEIGAGLYAPREIALIKDNKKELASFVSSVLVLKTLVLLITLIVYFITISVIPKFHSELWVFIFSAGFIIGETYIPVWFFQGIEKMVNITIGIFVIRVLALIAIFIFIRKENDYIYVPLINSCALIIGVFFMFFLGFLREGLGFTSINMKILRKTIKESFPLFVSSIFRNLHTGINILVLGFLSPNTIVGYYSAAERIIKVGMGILGQINNVFYPYTSRLLKTSPEMGIKSMKTGFVAGMLLAIPLTIATIVYSETVVRLMLGNEFFRSILPLKIMGLLFLAVGLGNILGLQILLPLGKGGSYMKTIIGGFIIHLVLALIFVPKLQEVGAAMVFVIAQAAMTFWLGYRVIKLSISIISIQTRLKLIILSLGLIAFTILSQDIGVNELISMGLFCTLYVCLIAGLGIVDFRNWSIITSD